MTSNVMKKFVFGLFLLIILNAFIVFGAVASQERAALIAFYNSTHGDQWVDNSGWKTPPLHSDGFALPGTEGSWTGITVTADHVTKIKLYDRKLTGTLPSQLGNLTGLEELWLSNLYVFDMDDWNQITGSIPAELGNLTNLKILHMSSNRFSGQIPSSLGNLTQLQQLSLGSNQLNGTIPASFGNLVQLQQLSLSSNQLSGSIPSSLGNLSNLQLLYLEMNHLTAIPSELGNLSNLKIFNISTNYLSGSIPATLGNLANLEQLILKNNQLTGSIPSQLGNLTHLKTLDLYNNQLSGSIPAELGNLGNLKSLCLGVNHLTGSIPAELGTLTNLVELQLYYNQLSGSIPAELGNLINLESFSLSHNQLSGLIPPSFWNLTKLNTIYIEYNCLEAGDPGIREWVNDHAGDNWEDTQYQCGQTINLPSVITGSVTSVKSVSAVCSGNVAADGGAPVTARGFCWSTGYTNPNINDSQRVLGSGTGSYSGSIWNLKPGTKYYIRAFATNSIGTAYGANVSFITPAAPSISLNKTSLIFGASTSGKTSQTQNVIITNTGEEALNWSATSDHQWLSFTPTSGKANSVLSVSVNPTGLEKGDYTGTILVSGPNASNSPQTLTVSLHVYDEGKGTAPIGEFSTPIEGTVLYNSIPLTGWALDDIEVSTVKIYNGNTYIGDAVFIEGARPDVEEAYPTYPNNNRAGWGYMLLSQFLPNQGNGTYTLTAKASDIEGNEITLGSKSITVDNAHAVKPFGAIDTPLQGETISGNSYVNFGWALTPPYGTIPTDGTFINVIIDGVNQGHPVYNILRSDVASLFPGYNNSNGAGGYFYIDTTKLKNGLHTIAWDVTDNNGNSEGIGSRYFTVNNTQSGSSSLPVPNTTQILDRDSSISGIGIAPELEWETIEINELERLEIDLTSDTWLNSAFHRHDGSLSENPNFNTEISSTRVSHFEGHLIVNNRYRECPVGSTLDNKRGIFCWQPGPGFIGQYRLIFSGKDENGSYINRNIIVNIKPMNQLK